MVEQIKKKRGRKPKQTYIDTSDIVHDITKSEDENIILHLPITISEINQQTESHSYFIKPQIVECSDECSSISDINITKNINDINCINKITIHNINLSCNTKCWWCHHIFTTPAIQLPEDYHNEVFYCIGNFCSFNCAKSYNLNINDNLTWKRLSLLNLLYYKTYSQYVDISLAPSWLVLSDYGGTLSINEFRNNFILNTKEYLVLHPPLISRQMQIEESYKINKTHSVPINNINKIYSDIDSELQLKRNKPVISAQMNLENTMGLLRGKKKKYK